jgi:PAS domain S-box-containing protein
MTNEATILAVDDTSDSLALLAEILTSAGYKVRQAGSGDLALADSAANPPDLILLDVRMNGMDGYEVCRRLKASEQRRHIPIILMSGVATVEEMMTGLQLGAADYMTRPFRSDELLMRVKTHLALSKANVSLEQQAAALRQTNEQLQSEILKRQRTEDELRQSLDRGERSLRAMLSTLEDQKRTEEALKEKEEWFRTVFENASDGMFFLTPGSSGEIVFANKSFASMHGYSVDEILKMSLKELDPRESNGLFPDRMRRVLAGESLTFEVEHRHKNGRLFPLEVTANLITVGGKKYILASHRDITRRRQAEVGLRKANRALRMTSQCVQEMVRATDEQALLQAVCRIAVEHGGYRMAWVGFAEQDKAKSVRPVAQAGFDEGYLSTVNITWADVERGRGPTGIAIRTGRPALARNIPADPALGLWREAAIQRGYVSSIALPLQDDSRCFGALMMYAAEPDAFDPAEVELLAVMANDLAYGIAALRHEAERKRADAELRAANEFNKEVISNANQGIIVYDRELRYQLWNRFMGQITGLPAEEVLGKKAVDVFPHLREQGIDRLLERALGGETVYSADIHYPVPRTAKICWFNGTYGPHRGASGEIVGVIGIVRDITERKQAEAEITRTAQEWQTTFDATNDAIWILDRNHRVLRTNKTAEHFFRRPCAEMIGKPCWEIVHGTTDPIPECPFVRARRSLRREMMELLSDGRWFEIIVDPILDSAGQFAGGVHIVSDITERKKAGEALRESEANLAAAQRIAHIGSWHWEIESNSAHWSDETYRIFGLTPGTLDKHRENFLALIHPQDKARVDQALTDALSGLRDYDLDYRITLPDGTEKIIHAQAEVLRKNDGKPLMLRGTVHDVTRHRQAEERIREQAALLNAANDAIYVRTLDHTVTFWNDGAERLYGWTRAEALGRKIHELIPYDRNAFETAHAVLFDQGNWSGELKMTSKAGNEITAFCRWTLVRDEQGQPREVLVINSDITEKKQFETQFLRAQRLEAIGSLSSGVAHDLNNILTPILMSAPLLRPMAKDSESRAILDTMEGCARRGADIIKQLLTFARGTPQTRVPLPVRHLLADLEKIVRETFPRNIQLRVEMPKDLWLVMGDATQIHQALMNLCVNARDAMPDGGTLTLAAKNLAVDETLATMMPDAKTGDYVCASVTDTGTGIPPKHLDRIFDPFFTTKEVGKGSGLGLATVLGIVRGHGGFVRVTSRVGRGTTFELYLPASPDTKAAARHGHEKLPPRARGELILVVDDEATVRQVVQRTLEKHGYQVVVAAEGNEAMAFLARHRARFHAVITDMMMPGMDGPALVQSLRRMESRLPVLGMTGLGERAGIKGLESLNLPALLIKPFGAVELLTALHELTASAAGKPPKN